MNLQKKQNMKEVMTMSSPFNEKSSKVLKEIKKRQYIAKDTIIKVCHPNSIKEVRNQNYGFNNMQREENVAYDNSIRLDRIGTEKARDNVVAELKETGEEIINEVRAEIQRLEKQRDLGGKTKNTNKKKKNKNKKAKKKIEKKNNKRLVTSMIAIQDGNIMLEENCAKKRDLNANLLAELMSDAVCVKVKNNTIRLYNEERGSFKLCQEQEFSETLRSLLNENNRRKISTQEYKEALNQLLRSKEVKMEGDFFANKPFVNCLNGVLDVENEILLPHSPDFLFKHCICANYNKHLNCTKFLKYLDFITSGDEELKELIQVMMGYIFSHYSNAKVAFLIYSAPHAGKSVLCRVIEEIVGEEATIHVDLSDFTKQEYAAVLDDMLLNVASDLENKPLKEVGCFKKLVSHDDTITTRNLYDRPKDLKSEAVMLFSSNHYLEFDRGVDINDVMAVFKRIIYIPFQNAPISEGVENKHMSEDLLKERDAIFTWAMEGLKKYVKNGERIPKSRLSEEVKNDNIARYCPEKVFYDTCIKEVEGACVRVNAIKESYDAFYRNKYPGKKGDIVRYMEDNLRIPKNKVRVNEKGERDTASTGKYVFTGIKIKDKYLV